METALDQAGLPQVGDTVGDKYQIECVLGSGGMGVVFGATHLLTHKRVAIKWLAAETSGPAGSDTAKRFLREVRLAGEFEHPNSVQIYDFGESGGSLFMVMEWLDGESLAARLLRVKRLSFREALDCLLPCMHAMQRAHDAGIIHRDLKPANIFLCDATDDIPASSKVLDFGISKRINNPVEVTSLVTKTGMLIGTPHYLSPEQLRARPADQRTDIYGFGVLLYETLSGELPFAADNFGDLVVQISTASPKSLRELVPHLPRGVEDVVARAMARDPASRYTSLRELINALQAIDPSPLTAATSLHSMPAAPERSSGLGRGDFSAPPTVQAQQQPARPSPVGAVVAVCLVTVAAMGTLYLFDRGGPSDRAAPAQLVPDGASAAQEARAVSPETSASAAENPAETDRARTAAAAPDAGLALPRAARVEPGDPTGATTGKAEAAVRPLAPKLRDAATTARPRSDKSDKPVVAAPPLQAPRSPQPSRASEPERARTPGAPDGRLQRNPLNMKIQ